MGKSLTSFGPSRRCRDRRWCRPPLLEDLEPRLPPGDTLLGLLAAGMLLDGTLPDTGSIIAPDPYCQEIRVAGAERDPVEGARRIVPGDGARSAPYEFEDSAPATLKSEELATWPTSTASWPGGSAAATIYRPISFGNSIGHVATWPHSTTLVPLVTGSATPIATLGAPPRLGAMLSRPDLGIHASPAASGRESMPSTSKGTDEAAGRFSQLPFYFEQNVGQAGEGLDFVARGAGYTLGLSATEAIMGFPGSSEPRPLGSGVALPPVADAPGSEDVTVRMQLLGGNPAATVSGVDPLATKINYFLGNDPAQWHTNIPTFARVQYDDVYPGIDLVYYGTQSRDGNGAVDISVHVARRGRLALIRPVRD